MKTKDFILQRLRKAGSVTTSRIVRETGLSRQTVAQHLRELVAMRALSKQGRTRNARYIPFSPAAGQRPLQPRFTRHYRVKGLQEDAVFEEVSLKMNLSKALSEPARHIAGYAFTEMLNNAIEHSKAPLADVALKCENGNFEFDVRDKGIGAFESLRRKFKLKDHFEAAAHLLKGKQTADPKHHSGQGIFFTSKIADHFTLESAKLRLVVDNVSDDTFLADIPTLKGTHVRFVVKQRSRKSLKALFDEYSDADYQFDKTLVKVSLSARPGQYVSRSEAKRLLFGLNSFRRIVLDFHKVQGVGQGFADEIFRVFQAEHADIQLEPINMSDAVRFMVKRAKNG